MVADGLICYGSEALSAIVGSSFLPISIIIIGVGSEDFSCMDYLDSDDKLLRD